VVVAAGSSVKAQALLGKTVATLGGGMYSQYRCVKAAQCLVLPPGTTAMEGASCFVNPLTALGMVETMRREAHSALVHTAAASNLGQMLNRLCIEDRIGLVNIVRTEQQERILREQGAKLYATERADLRMTLPRPSSPRATVAFDAASAARSLDGSELHGAALTLGRRVPTCRSTVLAGLRVWGRHRPDPAKTQLRYLGSAWLLPIFRKSVRGGTKAAHARRRRTQDTFAVTRRSRWRSAQLQRSQCMDGAQRAKYLISRRESSVGGRCGQRTQ
jgi:NADPH2:quinone reductase